MTTSAEAKRVWAMAQIEKARKSGNMNAVIVMPVFIEDDNGNWVPTQETGIDSKTNPNSEWCAINVIASQRTVSNNFVNEQFRSTLLRVKKVNNTFKPGEILTGKLYVVESTIPTNANDHLQDRKFINSEAQANDMPCTIDGEVIYRRVMFTDNVNEADQGLQHDNHDEIVAALAQLKVVNNKPQTAGIKNAGAKVAGTKK